MSTGSPTVSVVLPTYNADAHLRTCVDSILNQSFEDFEIVVVDDGSTDETISILASYEDERIRIIEREDESGITSALNRGIDESRGTYIARHDADDYSAPERFERQVDYLESHPDVALLGTGAWLVNERRGRIGRRRVLECPDLDALIEHNHYVHGSVMMRADALDAVDGYDEMFETTEDYDLWLRLAAEFPVRNLDDPLYNFRIHDDSIYASQLREVKLYHSLAVLRARDGLTDDLSEALVEGNGIDGVYDSLPRDLKQAFHAEMGQELIRYGHLSDGRDHCLKAFSLAGYTAVMPLLMVVLSFLGSGTARTVGSLYRKYVINPGIESENEDAPA